MASSTARGGSASMASEDAQMQEALRASMVDAPASAGGGSSDTIREFGTRAITIDELREQCENGREKEGLEELSKVFRHVRFFNNKLDLPTFYRAWALGVLTACMGVPPASVPDSGSSAATGKSDGIKVEGTSKKKKYTQFVYSPRPAIPGGGWGSWDGKPIEGDDESQKDFAARKKTGGRSGYNIFGFRVGTGSSKDKAGKAAAEASTSDGAELTKEDWTPLQPSMIPPSGIPKTSDPEMLRARMLGVIESCNPLLEHAGYEPMVIDDFKEDFMMQLLSAETMTMEQLLEFVETKGRIQLAIVFLKSMTGVGLWQKRAQLESFCKLRDSKAGIGDYRAKYIDATKAEAGVTEVVATVAAWSVPIRVWSWDELVGKPVVLAGGGYTCPHGFKGKPVVNLLWKDREYGLLETF